MCCHWLRSKLWVCFSNLTLLVRRRDRKKIRLMQTSASYRIPKVFVGISGGRRTTVTRSPSVGKWPSRILPMTYVPEPKFVWKLSIKAVWCLQACTTRWMARRSWPGFSKTQRNMLPRRRRTNFHRPSCCQSNGLLQRQSRCFRSQLNCEATAQLPSWRESVGLYWVLLWSPALALVRVWQYYILSFCFLVHSLLFFHVCQSGSTAAYLFTQYRTSDVAENLGRYLSCT